MKKLKRRCRILASSSLILLFLLLYYGVAIKEETSCEVAAQPSNISQEKTEVQKELSDEVTKEYEETQEKLNNEETIVEKNNDDTKENGQQVPIEEMIIPVEVEVDELQLGKTSYYGIVGTIGNVEQKYVEAIEERLLTLPPVLVNSFIEDGWNIYITSEDLAAHYGYKIGSVLGSTNYGERTIYIEDREKAILSAVEHEFGHYLDYARGVQSLGDEFNQIYQEEVETFKSNIPNPGCVSGPQEFFAETFAWIIVDEYKCTPKAKEFVERVLNELIYWEIEDTCY